MATTEETCNGHASVVSLHFSTSNLQFYCFHEYAIFQSIINKATEFTLLKQTKSYLTQKEVAARFRVTESTVKNWREKGLLIYFRVVGSTRVLYPSDSLEEFEKQSIHQDKEVVRPREIKRERPRISPIEKKVWRI